MANTVISVKPEFGVNYKAGYVGFTFTDNNFISNGIAWFTRWDKGENPDVPKINISHTFLVSDEGMCIEATNPCIMLSPISKYFDDPHTHVSFRKPIGLTDDIANRLILSAESQIGKPYDYVLIAGHAINDTLLGHLMSDLTHEKSKEFLTWLFSTKGRFICSELISSAMKAQPEYNGKGELVQPAYSIDPQELFSSRAIFSPWAEEVQGTQV